MQSKINNRTRRAQAALAIAAAATLASASRGLAQTTSYSTNSSSIYQYQNSTATPTYHITGTTWALEGFAGGKYSSWTDLNFSTALPAQTSVTGFGATPNITLDFYADPNATYDTKSNVTLDFYMTNDTATDITSPNGSTLKYETTSNPGGNPLTGGFDPTAGDVGTFGQTGIGTSGSQIVLVGAYTYNATGLTAGQLLSYSLSLSSPVIQSMVEQQLNGHGSINLAVVTSETDSNQATFYSSKATATAPTLIFNGLTTQSIAPNTALLYAGAYASTNTSKSVDVAVGTPINGNYYILANTTTTATVAISNGSTNSGDNLVYSVSNTSVASASTPGPEPIGPKGTSYVTVGFTSADVPTLTSTFQGGTPAEGSATLTNLSNNADPALSITLNQGGENSIVVNERYADSAQGTLNNGSATPNVGRLLIPATGTATYTSPNKIALTTTDPVNNAGTPDYSNDALTTETLAGNSTATVYNYTDSFYNPNTTDSIVAVMGANTNGLGNQTFDANETNYAYATIKPLISGVFGNYTAEAETTYKSNNTPNYATFTNANGITGEGLQGESDTIRVYAQWSAYQAASVSDAVFFGSLDSNGNTGTNSVKLTNAASNDNVFTPTAGTTYNNGLRADAWVTGYTTTGGSDWTAGVTAAAGSTAGTVVPGGGSITAPVSFYTSDKLNGTYGASITIGLENDQTITGATANDAGSVSFPVTATITDKPAIENGTYTFNGGTFTDPAGGTNLTGTFTQTAGTSTFNNLSGTGNANITGGTANLLNASPTVNLYLTGSGSANVSGGSATFNTVNSTGSLAVTGGTASLTNGSSTTSVTVTGSGSLNVNGGTSTLASVNTTGDLAVNGAVAILAHGSGTESVAGLSLSNNGSLDITNNTLIINYGSGSDPISSIAAMIASGYNANGTHWTGAGITSSTAQGNSSYGIGYADYSPTYNPAGLSSGQLEITYTLLGDANLDHKVNGDDFTLLANNFNDLVTNGWDQGDFNFSNNVNGDDFVLLANNFNDFASQSAVGAADLTALDDFAAANGISLTSVPEPASLGLLTLGLTAALARRRRKPPGNSPGNATVAT